jgi:peptidoglycan/LPS O-acetylase OafA/YrhL
MSRERALQIVVVLVGLLFAAGILPAIWGLRDPANSDTGDTMQMAIYATLGVFLLRAARRPAEHRSLIAFAAWSSIAHGIVMATLGFELPPLKSGFVIGSAGLAVIAILLLALSSPRGSSDSNEALLEAQSVP